MPPYIYDENGRRVPTPTKGALRERAILDAAEAQLDTEGPDGMTVESIATAAGITRAALYFYFRSKNDVLTALVQRAVDELTSGVATAGRAVAGPSASNLEEALRRTGELWIAHGAVMRAAVELAPRVGSVAALWDAARDDVRAHALEIVTQGSTAPLAGPDGAPAVVAALVTMTERSLYEASKNPSTLPDVIRTQHLIWTRALQLTEN